MTWPDSLGFTHVSEAFTETLPDGSQGFEISPALKDEFLPQREKVFETFLSQPPCPGGGCASIAASSSGGGPGPIVATRTDEFGQPLPLSSEEVEALDARLKQGQSLDTLGGPRRSH